MVRFSVAVCGEDNKNGCVADTPPPPSPRVINIFEAYTRKILIDMKNLFAEGKEIKIVVKNLVVEHLTVVNCSLHVIVRVQRKSFLKVATLLYILGNL